MFDSVFLKSLDLIEYDPAKLTFMSVIYSFGGVLFLVRSLFLQHYSQLFFSDRLRDCTIERKAHTVIELSGRVIFVLKLVAYVIREEGGAG
jgi:hypothetical protein